MVPYLRLVRTPPAPESEGSDKLPSFLKALTELSDRYGIAIGDGAELYEMEPEDRLAAYDADADSRLTRV